MSLPTKEYFLCVDAFQMKHMGNNIHFTPTNPYPTYPTPTTSYPFYQPIGVY